MTETSTHSETETPTNTETSTPSETLTPSESLTPSETVSLTATGSPTVTATGTATQTVTTTGSVTRTGTNTRTPSRTGTPTRTFTPTPIPIIVGELATYPNPAFDIVHFVFTCGTSGEVTVAVYTISGRFVRDLTGPAFYGTNEFIWDGRNSDNQPVASGVYLWVVRLKTTDDQIHTSVSKMTMLR